MVGCCFCWFFLACVFLVCFFVWSVSFHQWNNIIRLWHYEYRKLDTLSASLAVINTASKHLHNDLAKAIEALEEKKNPVKSRGVQVAQEGIRVRMITSSSSQRCRSKQPPGGALGWFPPLLLARLGEGRERDGLSFSFLLSWSVLLFSTLGSFRCQSTSRHGNRCCFLAQPYLNHIKKTQLRTDMPRRQTKKTENTQGGNDALTLLRLQQHVLQLTTAKAALEDIQTLVHETTLSNFTSAQDRRTLNTAQCCLNSLRIRVEAHVNSVEEAVKQPGSVHLTS